MPTGDGWPTAHRNRATPRRAHRRHLLRKGAHPMADDDVKTEETFTRGQVRAMIGAEVKKVREQFADYDDLKARAAEADQSKGKIDQVLEKLAIADKRAADAELATMRRDVADELGLTAKQARKLHGST